MARRNCPIIGTTGSTQFDNGLESESIKSYPPPEDAQFSEFSDWVNWSELPVLGIDVFFVVEVFGLW